MHGRKGQCGRIRFFRKKEAPGWLRPAPPVFSGTGCLLRCELDALLEDVEGDIGLLLVDDEGRAEADAGFAAAEDEQAALEGEIDDLVAHGAGGCAGFLVFLSTLDDLDADHQTAAADV